MSRRRNSAESTLRTTSEGARRLMNLLFFPIWACVTLEKHQDSFAYNPSYVEHFRRGNAYHGAHPFHMWYWSRPAANTSAR